MPKPTVHPSPPRGTKRALRNRHALRPSDSLDGHPTPSLTRAVPLPGSRAVVGALLITLAAVGVFAAYRSSSEGPSTPVVVIATDLPVGHRLEAADLRLERADLPATATGNTFNSVAAVEGGVTLAPLRTGELVQRSAVLTTGAQGPPSREFSFAVDRERAVNGAIQQGERVDVLATFGTGDSAYSSVVARDVAVIEVDNLGKSNAIGASGKLTITVSMANGDDVLRLAHATQVAPITLIRTTRSEGADPGTLDTYRAPGGKVDSKSPSTTTPIGTGSSPPPTSTNGSSPSSTNGSSPTSSAAGSSTTAPGNGSKAG